MVSRISIFIFFTFLLFPKIPVTREQGILIGEALLSTLGLLSVLLIRKKKYFRVTGNIILLVSFYLFFILISSVINGITHSIFPTLSFFYFTRVIIFVFIYFLVRFLCNKYNDKFLIENLIIAPFLIHFIINLIIVSHYYITQNPSISWMVWGYEVGLRMIPISALTFDWNSPYFLVPKSGSGNILSSWSIFILLLTLTYPEKLRWRRSIIIISTIVPFFAMSRGGVLTTLIIWFYYLFLSGRLKVSDKIKLITLSCFLLITFSVAINYFGFTFPNIFERVSRTFVSGRFDSSVLGRFENYTILFDFWSRSIINMVFGIGFDPNLVSEITTEKRFESFYLQVLFSGGIISLFFIILLLLNIYVQRNLNYWTNLTFLYFLFESIVMWTVTGAGFWSPQISFIMMLLFGLASMRNRNDL